MLRLRTGVLFLFLAFMLLPGIAAAAGMWSYGITASDTPQIIDTANTTAKVDTVKHEILLPDLSFGLIDFQKDGGTGYVVLTRNGAREFEFDGTQMVENPITSVTGLNNPLALAAAAPYPDVVVASQSGVKHFSFTGSGMVENPALSVSGLSNVVSVGTSQNGQLLSTLSLSGDLKRYLFDGTGMVEAPSLTPGALNNPLALAQVEDYDLAILERDRVRWFNYTGSGMAENPALIVTGLTSPVALAAADGEMAVIDGKQVRHYSFDGAGMTYNSALSLTAGLTNPVAVAIKPGSYDRIIADGNEVKYYSFDGTQLVYNPSMSVTVADLALGGAYASPASAQSQGKDPAVNADRVRVRAYHALPAGTTVTWAVTADGTNWVTSWRVRGTVTEVTLDNGVSWQPIGDMSQVSPAVDRPELWTEVTPGRSVRFKATLSTTDQTVTPKIVAQGGLAVVLEADAKPDPPVVPMPGSGWFYTTTPTFTWTFSDPDAGDRQTAYQVVVKTQSDDALVYDSGKVISDATSFTLPTSDEPNVPGPLWNSGEYAFTVQIRVWDRADVASDYSLPYYFKVLAFERPRISEITSPPVGQAAPDPDDPASHIMITRGMTEDKLPRAKAGTQVTLLLDSVGPVQTPAEEVADFSYGADEIASQGDASELNPLGSKVNRWSIPFWTDASLSNTPDGTVITLRAAGTGTEGGTMTLNLPPYADGVVVTQGSVYEDWFVVLQGQEN